MSKISKQLFLIILSGIILMFAMHANAAEICSSKNTVKETADLLQVALKAKNIQIFKRINFSADAKTAKLNLADEELIIFGNPKAGTLLLQENPQIGLVLPLKILIWKNANGQTQVGYIKPSESANEFNLQKNSQIIQQMDLLMQQLTQQLCK